MVKFYIQKVANKKAEQICQPTTLGECMEWIVANTIDHPTNEDVRCDPNDFNTVFHIIRVEE